METTQARKVKETFGQRWTKDGAGVKLNRVFGFHEIPKLDPFLLLDFFDSENPEDYQKGFPWHPHRGIETVTYLIHGRIAHGDSLGNSGVIEDGDCQWMTAGSGIIHQDNDSIKSIVDTFNNFTEITVVSCSVCAGVEPAFNSCL